MQKQEISNIMIFFVTQDLEGQPRQLEMHLMPRKRLSSRFGRWNSNDRLVGGYRLSGMVCGRSCLVVPDGCNYDYRWKSALAGRKFYGL